MTTVRFPWPPQPLWPNRRFHWRKVRACAREARWAAWALAKGALVTAPKDGPITVAIQFLPPDRRRRDFDGMLSASKPLLDGLADALGVDDSRFRPTLDRGEPVKGGAVEITIGGRD